MSERKLPQQETVEVSKQNKRKGKNRWNPAHCEEVLTSLLHLSRNCRHSEEMATPNADCHDHGRWKQLSPVGICWKSTGAKENEEGFKCEC